MTGNVKLAAATVAPVLFVAILLTAVLGEIGPTLPAPGTQPSNAALADIPPTYLVLYQQAATADCPGLDWSVLAAIGKVETDHGRSSLPGVTTGENSAGAGGQMQILEPTWNSILRRHIIPPGGAQPPSRYNPHDAIHAAAFYLCDSGGAGDLRAAVFAYNHSASYVADVLTRAAAYRQSLPTATAWDAEPPTVPDPSGTGGRVTPRLDTLYQALKAFGAITRGATCWDPHLQNPDSDHPLGKACDVFFDPGNTADVTRGWQAANWLTAQQAVYGVRYLIWQGQIWTAEQRSWKPYTSKIYGCPNPRNVTGCHFDHIHISVY